MRLLLDKANVSCVIFLSPRCFLGEGAAVHMLFDYLLKPIFNKINHGVTEVVTWLFIW